MEHSLIDTTISNHYPRPPPKSNMSLPVVTIMKERRGSKRGMMKIGVEYILTANIGEMEEKTMEGEIRSTRKELVGCVRASK